MGRAEDIRDMVQLLDRQVKKSWIFDDESLEKHDDWVKDKAYDELKHYVKENYQEEFANTFCAVLDVIAENMQEKELG